MPSSAMPSTSLPVSRPSGAPTLGALSGAVLKQQAPTPETLRRVPSGMESTFKPGKALFYLQQHKRWLKA